MKPQLWSALKQTIEKNYTIPTYAAEVLAQSWSFIEKANLLNVESKLLDASYLAFLDEQIQLGARGEEWTNVLRRRKTQLSPYVDKILTTLTLQTAGGTVVIKFCGEDDSLVLFEALDNSDNP